MDRFNPHHKHTDFLIGNTYKIRDWKWNEWRDKRSIEEIKQDISLRKAVNQLENEFMAILGAKRVKALPQQ